MSADLILCVSQNEALYPYEFSITGIKAYSFEEALYHVYHNWKESLDDFLSAEFIGWVKGGLDEKYLASQIEGLNQKKDLVEQLTGFLTLIDYFDLAQLAVLNAELMQWEKQLEWERLKDMADQLVRRGDFHRAYIYYKKALNHGDNMELYNNAGIALMRMELYPEAAGYFAKAYEMDKENLTVMLNFSEALIYSKELERAFKYLKKAERYGENGLIYYLYGILCVESGNYQEAVGYIKKAITMDRDISYYYTLADIYCKMRKFTSAIEIFDQIDVRDTVYFTRQAEVYAAYEDYPAAVKCIERAVVHGEKDNCYLWTMLAMYYRLGYDLEKAEMAIIKALNVDNENKHAKLEQARIKKAQGKTKDYQLVLNRILQSFKREYRKITEV